MVGHVFYNIGEHIFQQASDAIQNNTRSTAIVVGSVVGGAVLGPLLMGPALGALGFSAIGPVAGKTFLRPSRESARLMEGHVCAGSLAAGAQSAGAVGAVFSTLQSAGMGGYGVAVVSSVFAGTGAVVGGTAGAGAVAFSEMHAEGEDQSEDLRGEDQSEDAKDQYDSKDSAV